MDERQWSVAHSPVGSVLGTPFLVPLCDFSHGVDRLFHFGVAQQFIGVDVSATSMGYVHLGFGPFV